MRILKAIEAFRLRREAPPRRHVRFTITETKQPPELNRDVWERWRIELRLGIEVTEQYGVPDFAHQHQAVMEHAYEAIAHELYGEIEDDLRELYGLLAEEGWRPTGDPVAMLIDKMFKKLRGRD
jgi:hypothetical protein